MRIRYSTKACRAYCRYKTRRVKGPPSFRVVIALIELKGNYQKQGHIEEGEFVILKPLRKNVGYRYNFASKSMKAAPLEKEFWWETISYYEVASYLFKHGLYRALTTPEFNRYMKQGLALTGENPSGRRNKKVVHLRNIIENRGLTDAVAVGRR